MDELSERARSALGRLAQGLAPERAHVASTWARIEAQIEREARSSAQGRARRSIRALRIALGGLRRTWRPIAMVTVVVLALAPLVRSEMGGSAHLEMARSLIAQGEHRRAYNVLVSHARLYKSKRVAEERMELALQALCGLKMHERAEDDLRRYLELAPESPLASRRFDPCRP